MSTAVVAPPTTAPSLASAIERNISPRTFAALAPSTSSAPPTSAAIAAEPASKRARSNASPAAGERSLSNERSTPGGAKISPSSLRSGPPPMIKIKKEQGSPSMQSARPRPKRLDLSSSSATGRGPQTARPSAPLTSARESAGLAIQDVGLACLSPGFQTNDPSMRSQLQRSLDVREQQRQIIEARQKGGKPGSSHENSDGARTQDGAPFGIQARTPTTSKRKGPPPGLSINAPSATQFAHDRVIQSAPLHQTFTGLRPDQQYTRHAQHGPSGLSQTSHIHHIPATQTNNRLPPIADVFANDRLDARPPYPNNSPPQTSHHTVPPPVPSPGFGPPHTQYAAPMSSRAREFRSADEAMASLSGGRDELMPKVVHYGGVQPPTPPSPYPGSRMGQSIAGAPPAMPNGHHDAPGSARPDFLNRTASMNGRRRGRDEYERDNGSPPSAFSRPEPKRAAFAVRGEDEREKEREADWKTGLSGTEKREEFLRLCERAWDLFHS